MKLKAGAVIKKHRDHELSFEEGEARLHIPLVTNENVYFMLDGERILMKEGECWYLDLTLEHSVENRSQADRIHLVMDVKVNDWLKQLFVNDNLLKKEIEEIKAPSYNRREQIMIIEQLRTLNTKTSLELADKMEKELS
jgi:aspartyl/asparaginyl beta-hydroxylase (cupin superfamily)